MKAKGKSVITFSGIYYTSNRNPRVELFSVSPRRKKIGESIEKLFTSEIVVDGKRVGTLNYRFNPIYARIFSLEYKQEEYIFSTAWGLRPTTQIAKNGKSLFWITGAFYREKKGYVSDILDSNERKIGTITADMLHLYRCPFEVVLEKSGTKLDAALLLALSSVRWSGGM